MIKNPKNINEILEEINERYSLLSKEIEEKTKMANFLYLLICQLENIKNGK